MPYKSLGFLPVGDKGVALTVQEMRKMVREYDSHPFIVSLARWIMGRYKPKNKLERVKAIADWIHRNITYVNDPFSLELLQNPIKTVKLKAGDCDDQTTLACSLLRAIRIPCGFRTIAPGMTRPRGKPLPFSHVYPYAIIDGVKFPFDPTQTSKVPWEYPFRARVKDWEV